MMATKEQDALLAMFRKLRKKDRMFLLLYTRNIMASSGRHGPADDDVDTVADQATIPVQVQGENCGLGDGDVIRMDKNRSRRFERELGKLWGEIVSLSTSAESFPHVDVSQGCMSPSLTVSAFTKSMRDRVFLLQAMVNDEERKTDGLQEEAREASYAQK